MSDLEDVGGNLRNETKACLLRETSSGCDVTIEAVNSVEHTYSEAVVKYVVRETRLRIKEAAPKQALETRSRTKKRK